MSTENKAPPDSNNETSQPRAQSSSPVNLPVAQVAPRTALRRFLRVLSFPLVVLAAFILWFEEWLWEPMVRLMRWFGSLPVLRQLETFMRKASPYLALGFFVVPVIAIFPFKIGGLWLIARHHILPGLFVFLGAKLVGTAIMAWILSCTKPALMQLRWFAWCWYRFDTAKAWLFERVRQHPAWQWGTGQIQQIRVLFKHL